ncbi:Periplasmic [NiFeSe] hydrogenase large subunit [Phycisphaerae bacterium RAS1]|nr:Periplasmic [NiFeSe] hydrogenase large subunit [Phycisphaerae bacterium RAS1]
MKRDDPSPKKGDGASGPVTIEVHEVTRVEGHGSISVRLDDGEITKLELQIIESPRFFEAFLRGRRYDEVPHITGRVCGICSVGHTTAATKAIEAACGIAPSEQTLRLRKLILMGEEIQSHVLHLYFLAAPDFLGVGSVIPLAKTHPDVVKRALRMKKLANDLCRIVGGRHIHPIAYHVGGFSHWPKIDELREMKQRLETARADLEETAALFSRLAVPELHRDTEYLSLTDTGGKQPRRHGGTEKDERAGTGPGDIDPVRGSRRKERQSEEQDTPLPHSPCLRDSVVGFSGEYAFYDGDLVSTRDPRPTPVADYRRRVIEDVVAHSAAKHCRSPHSPTFAVGALARFNNNHAQLHPAARRVAEALGLKAPCDNPFHNNTAQLVETVHCMETAISLIDALLADPPRPEPRVQPTRFARGVGAAEVPRGVLFHEYTLDDKGRVAEANLIIPTGQNLANIEADMRAIVPQMLGQGAEKDQIQQRLEMLVRAYDPCISCATHFLDIEWV